MRFIFFTKDNWSDQARLRHQLAKLLINSGHKVIFFQNPKYFFQNNNFRLSKYKGIKIITHKQLIHHRLRITPHIHNLNSTYEKKNIIEACKNLNITNNDIIINFCYDYYFLRDLFLKNKIVTMINDDYISKSVPRYQKLTKKILKETLIKSDIVLTVSKIIKQDLDKIVKNVKLFYPWTNLRYQKPKKSKKNKIIYWGYINDRIDFEYLIKLAFKLEQKKSKIKIILYGPLNISKKKISKILNQPNIYIHPPKDINKIDLSDFFAAIIPYKSGIPENDCITFPNKLAPLLSKGLHICKKGMPKFVSAKFIHKLSNDTSKATDTLIKLKLNYSKYQYHISNFIKKNNSKTRLKQFYSILKL